MARKRRKKKNEEEIISLPPEAKVEETVEEETIEEEIITGLDSPLHRVFPVEETIEIPPPPEPPKTKKIKYLGVDILIMKGPVTGERYRFTAKDPISEVAIEDYEGLLKKVTRARRCCGRKPGDPGRMVPSQPFFGPV